VLGVCTYLKATNNNGVTTEIHTDLNVTITKMGGHILTATADVVDRSGAGVQTAKINVKP
jgi:hypothetical protein